MVKSGKGELLRGGNDDGDEGTCHRRVEGHARHHTLSKGHGKRLCLRARISRNTFYANFEDKDDVIRLVFESSVLQPIRDLNRLLDLSDLELLMERMNEQMYERLAAEGEFFKNLIGPIFGQDDTFLRIATQAIYQLNMELIPKTTRLADGWHTDYIAYFFASSQAMLMQKWVADGMRVSPKELADLYGSVTGTSWRSIAK